MEIVTNDMIPDGKFKNKYEAIKSIRECLKMLTEIRNKTSFVKLSASANVFRGMELAEGYYFEQLFNENIELLPQKDKALLRTLLVNFNMIKLPEFTSVATHWLPAMMMRFQQEHPQVEFELFNGDYHDVDRWLADGSVDLAFVALPAEADSRCVPLYRDELVAVLPKGHRLCSLPVCPAAEIAKEPIISLLETSNHDVRRALDAVGAKPDIRFRTKDDYAVIAMVRQGLGVSIMPSLLLRGNNEGVELRPLDPPAYRTIALTMGSVETGPAARQFAEFARAWVKENA